MKAGALNPSCWGHEHSWEANTPWKIQTTAYCLAAGCRSPNCGCVLTHPGLQGERGQRGLGVPEQGCEALCCWGRPTRGSQEKSKGGSCSSAAGPRVRPARRGSGPSQPRPRRQPRPARGAGPPRVNNTFTHVNTQGGDVVGNLCRQRLT